MGYTHYFFNIGKRDPQKWQSIFPKLSTDAAKLIDASGIGLESFKLTDDLIWIDGGHETFVLHAKSDDEGMGFCKTARKPYDDIVTAILLRVTMLMGHGEDISSDGDWEEWMAGRELIAAVFPGEEVKCPWGDSEE